MARDPTFQPFDISQARQIGNATGAADGGLPGGGENWFGGLQDVSDALVSFAAFQQREEDTAEGYRVSEAADTYQLQLAERLTALDPTSETYTKDVQTAVTELTRNTTESTPLRGKHRQEQLQGQLRNQSNRALIGAMEARKSALTERAVTKFQDQANATLNQIFSRPGDWDAAKQDFLTRITPALDAVPQADRESLVHSFLNDAVIKRAQGMADAGDFEGARSFMAANSGDIDTDKVIAVDYFIEGKENRHKQEQREAEAAARSAALHRAKLGQIEAEKREPFEDDEGGLEDLPIGIYAEGAHEEARQELRNIAVTSNLTTKATAKAAGEAIDKFVSGRPLSSKESNTVFNALYRQSVAAAERSGLPREAAVAEALTSTTMQMISQTGQVPEITKTQISALSRHGGADELAQAAYTVDQIERSAPWASSMDTGLSDRGKVIRELTRDRLGGQTPTLDDYKLTAGQVQGITTAEADQRRKNANDLFANTTMDKFVEQTGLPADTAVEREWRDRARAHFALTGDENQARALATKELKGQFNKTYVGGQERTIRGPAPEMLAPVAIREAMGDDAVAGMIDDEIKAALPADTKFVLQADEQTKPEAPEGKAPSYPVMVEDPDAPGMYRQHVVRQGDRAVFGRWTAPANDTEWWSSEMVQKKLREKSEAIGANVGKERVTTEVPDPQVFF